MRRAAELSSLAGLLALAGCVVLPPAGPTLQALPGSRSSFEQFRFDDAACRQYATAQIGGRSATEAAQDSQAASVVAGTAIGAAAGAVLGGSSEAAAVGAGVGLLTGAMAGWGASQGSYDAAQRRYDGAYYACMYARGHKVPVTSRYTEATYGPAPPPRGAGPPADAAIAPPNAPPPPPPPATPYVPPYWPGIPPPNAPPPR
ncbi:MAG: hypothetical protein MUF32_06645 [Burkholderiaceae bacterium]|jgi:hypothetical protein|nr:hypothetical protein [Burkholderiaceae bacterium]